MSRRDLTVTEHQGDATTDWPAFRTRLVAANRDAEHAYRNVSKHAPSGLQRDTKVVASFLPRSRALLERSRSFAGYQAEVTKLPGNAAVRAAADRINTDARTSCGITLVHETRRGSDSAPAQADNTPIQMRAIETAFRAFLEQRRLNGGAVTAPQAVNAWIDFYEQRRADGVAPDMDWLWFQYGNYGFGGPPSFQLDLTRQFIFDGADGEDAIFQLRWVLHYPADPALRSGLIDCNRPEDAPTFRSSLLSNDLVTRFAGQAPDRVELTLDNTD